MHQLTLFLGDNANPLRFLFRTKEPAQKFYEDLSNFPTQDLKIVDDFGQVGEFKALSIHGRMLENLDESHLAYVEMMLHNTIIQAKAQQRANADPILRSMAAASSRGTPILTPMGNGRLS